MMVILKIPIVYLCGVVWWAWRAEPKPPEGAQTVAVPVEPEPPAPWFAPPPARSRPAPPRPARRPAPAVSPSRGVRAR